jgi:hypothetical protein
MGEFYFYGDGCMYRDSNGVWWFVNDYSPPWHCSWLTW